MSGYGVSTVTGRIQAGEKDSLFLPRDQRKGRYGVVLVHGAGSPSEFLDTTNQITSVRFAANLADRGITCVAGDFGGDVWGNNTHVSRIAAAAALLASSGCSASKVCLLGVSMGAAGAVKYAQLNPNSVAAIYSFIPVSDIDNIYQSNAGGLRASIGTAWGVTYPTPLPSGANLQTLASSLVNIPGRLDYGSADTVVQPSTVTALATAWGSNCIATVTDTVNNHSDAILAKTNPDAIVQFFFANGA